MAGLSALRLRSDHRRNRRHPPTPRRSVLDALRRRRPGHHRSQFWQTCPLGSGAAAPLPSDPTGLIQCRILSGMYPDYSVRDLSGCSAPIRASDPSAASRHLPFADSAKGRRRCCCTRLFRLLWRQSDNRDEAGRRTMKSKLFGTATIAALAFTLQPVAAQTPIKIGFISTFSGSQSAIGDALPRSVQLAKEHLGGTMGGAPAESVYEDDQFKPYVGMQKSETLVRQDKVAVISRDLSSNLPLTSL